MNVYRVREACPREGGEREPSTHRSPACHSPLQAGNPVARGVRFVLKALGLLDRPVKPGDDT
jgi:hypothetical protein